MRLNRLDVAEMAERDYFAQLICWRRGADRVSDSDVLEAENILKNEFRDSLRILDARLQHPTTRK